MDFILQYYTQQHLIALFKAYHYYIQTFKILLYFLKTHFMSREVSFSFQTVMRQDLITRIHIRLATCLQAYYIRVIKKFYFGSTLTNISLLDFRRSFKPTQMTADPMSSKASRHFQNILLFYLKYTKHFPKMYVKSTANNNLLTEFHVARSCR